ncbi:hypothetical protein BD289DRAFT_60572 [Coniella lustricola]|uniref:Uncharacterized protein n=1 Tax=Coniella lustricola TaxID=2025994 RepID=A0A2T3A0R7_9PEZI|nr:hypothetical protein BD289DRAFT_60572 [Coniella lustricola]
MKDKSSKKDDKPQVSSPATTTETTPPLNSPLTIYPTAYYGIQSLAFDLSVWGQPNYERSYLLDSLRRQRKRSEGLAHNLDMMQTRLASVQSKTELRKLFKRTDLLRVELAQSFQQEQMVLLRLKDMVSVDQGHMMIGVGQEGYYQVHGQQSSLSSMAEPYASDAAAAIAATATTVWCTYSHWNPTMWSQYPQQMDPISPLTPLPVGLYHPPPTIPSPLASPYWPGTPDSTADLMTSTNGSLHYTGVDFRPPSIPPPFRRTPLVTNGEHGPRHRVKKSVEIVAMPQEDRYIGRRWSHADVFFAATNGQEDGHAGIADHMEGQGSRGGK